MGLEYNICKADLITQMTSGHRHTSGHIRQL